MRCPECGNPDSRVVDSRPAEQQTAVRRRRLCEECGARFTTYERVAAAAVVRKRSGRLEPFSAEKLRRGIAAALAGRPVPERWTDDLVEEVEGEVLASANPVATQEIGRTVLDRLRVVDEVAYVRFASVYKDFKRAEDFERELAALDVTPTD
jgi:transcriptional repressor NrdR